MYAMFGTSSNAKTFPLFIHINNTKVLTLIDSGSTTTFLDPSVLARAKLQVTNHAPVKVIVANGGTL
jgi:predicted aspartyl protease